MKVDSHNTEKNEAAFADIQGALQESVKIYERIHYTGEMPNVGQRHVTMIHYPALRWAAVAAALVLAFMWSAHQPMQRIEESHVVQSKSTTRGHLFSIPSMPSRPASTPATAHLGAARQHVVHLESEIRDDMRRYLRMPSPPVMRKTAPSNDGAGHSTHHRVIETEQAMKTQHNRRHANEA